MKSVKLVFSTLITVITVCGCMGKSDKCNDLFGLAYNQNRIELDIPIIEPDWIIHDCDTNFVYWSNRQNRVISEEPTHQWKRLYLSNKAITQEEDVFHFESSTNKAYRLIIRWFPDNIDSTNFRLITYFKDEFPPTEGRYIDLTEADSVLKSWGFKSW